MPRFSTLVQLRVALLLVVGSVLPLATGAVAEEAPAASDSTATESIYEDPAGRFTVPVPTKWTVEAKAGYVALSDPDGTYHIYVMAMDEPELDAALKAAWELVGPGERRVAIVSPEIPPPPGVDQVAVKVYDDGSISGRSSEGIVQLVDGTSYVLLLEGDVDTSVRRASQIQIIASGSTSRRSRRPICPACSRVTSPRRCSRS